MTRRSKKGTHRNYADPAADPRIQAICDNWSATDKYQKGKAINLLRSDYTLKELESVLPCSEKRIRDYEIFGRTSADPAKFAGTGAKKILAWERRRSQFRRQIKKLSRGRQARKLTDKLTRTVTRWITETLNPWTWDVFFEEILTIPATQELVRKHKPDWWRCDPEGDWDKIIRETRPARDPEETSVHVGGLTDYYVEWFACWYQRCVPIPRIENVALERARKILRQKLRDMGPGERWHSPY